MLSSKEFFLRTRDTEVLRKFVLHICEVHIYHYQLHNILLDILKY